MMICEMEVQYTWQEFDFFFFFCGQSVLGIIVALYDTNHLPPAGSWEKHKEKSSEKAK